MLIKRNVLLFFRDKASVFFSLLGALLILMLYVLFLGDMLEAGLRAGLGFDSPYIRPAMASIILAGMVAVTSVTSCTGAMETRVNDREGAGRDFLTSPISRGKLTRSYMLGSAVIGLIMTLLILGLSLIYIAAIGGGVPGLIDWALLAVTVVLCVLCANAMMFFLTAFVKTAAAFASLSAVIGALIGFIMGIYIPIGTLPDAVQWVVRLFPMSHAASMFRQILSDAPLQTLFAGAPPEVLGEFQELYGIVFHYGDFVSSFWFSAAFLVVTTVVFYTLSVVVMRRQRG
ncbi:MAG: ABC transporter permease [Oscillospiraceae bacterium]|nr:ABC transporter permease [Oscillospiraceae bacterium]